jgi:hypothetical protein
LLGALGHSLLELGVDYHLRIDHEMQALGLTMSFEIFQFTIFYPTDTQLDSQEWCEKANFNNLIIESKS